MTPAEAIDLALPLLKRAAAEQRETVVICRGDPLAEVARARVTAYTEAWNTLQALRTEQAEAALVAKDPANQGQRAGG